MISSPVKMISSVGSFADFVYAFIMSLEYPSSGEGFEGSFEQLLINIVRNNIDKNK